MTAENLRREAEAALLEAREQRAEVAEQLSTVEASKVEILEEARRELLGRNQRDAGQVPTDGEGLGPSRKPAEPERRPGLPGRSRGGRSYHLSGSPSRFSGPEWHERIKQGDRVSIRGIGRPVEVH